MAIAGKVSIVPRGEWSATEVYTRIDLVTYNRNAYLALKESTGIQPTNEEYWMLLIENVSSAEIEDLQTQIDDIIDDIADIIGGTTKVSKATTADNATNATNAETVNGFKIFREISQIGVTSYHIPDIVKAMPNGSMFVTSCYSSSGTYETDEANNQLPFLNAVIEIIKPKEMARTRVLLTSTLSSTKGETYICDLDENEWVINGWKHIGDGGNSKKLNGLTAEEFVSNENLLINPYFKNPVNTSGKTEWSGNTNLQNVFDKWIFEGLDVTSTLVLDENGANLNKGDSSYCSLVIDRTNFDKVFTDNVGKEFTISIKANGEIYATTFTSGGYDGGGIVLFYADDGTVAFRFFYLSNERLYLRSYVDTITIEWAKLELGSVATPFIPPNKEVEKLKCGIVDSTTLTKDLQTTKKNLGIPLIIPTGTNSATAPDNEGWYKVFEVSTNAWATYAIEMTINPSNLINNTFTPSGITLVLKSGSTGKYAPYIYHNFGGSDILKQFYVVQNSASATDSFEVWYKNDTSYSQATITLYAPNSRNRRLHWGEIVVNPDAIVALDSTTEGKDDIYCFADIAILTTNADTVDGLGIDDITSFKFINSGSFNDIINRGLYYVANAVEDKPDTVGGLYILSSPYNDGVTQTGLYIPNNSAHTPFFVTRASSNQAMTGLLTFKNSASVKISTTAPTDTTALWIDTANKATKAYIDGAWTPV